VDEVKRTVEIKLVPREKREILSLALEKEKEKETAKSKRSKQT
jgi:hypothetical protein